MSSISNKANHSLLVTGVIWCCLLLISLCSQVSQAQTWTAAYFRGVPNNWGATAMVKNTTTGLWETQQTFTGTNPGFKISRNANDWVEAYPSANWLVTTGNGDYKITFNDTNKAIVVTKLPISISANSICYNNISKFAAPYIYFWAPSPAGRVSPLPSWPGKAMTQRGNYYCYDFTALLAGGGMPTSLNVIFSNNGSSQTPNLTYANGNACYDNGTWKSLQQCGFAIAVASSSSSLSSSSLSSSSKSSSSSSAATSSSSSSVTTSSSSSLSSSSISSVTPAKTIIYFKNTANYATPYIHTFAAVPARADSLWPGAKMTSVNGVTNGGWYSYEFAAPQVTSSGIVFSNNGSPKSADLTFAAPNNCYNGTSWQTVAACGVPVVVANAGVDRKTNVNTRQVLSAAASTGTYTSANWTSPAWSGALLGAQVITPVLTTTGTYTVTLTLTSADGTTSTDTMVLTVVAATQGLPERPLLAAPLKFPTTGSVSNGAYRFVKAFPNLDGLFNSPVLVLSDKVNSNLIYVVDKVGTVSVFPNEETVTTSAVRKVLDISSVVRNNHEMGLLSMAFDPNFASNGYIYVYYIFGTNDNPVMNGVASEDAILERWTVNSTTNPTGVVPGSKVEILRVPQVGPDHKGGMMQFHPTEGYLYLGIGDGGYAHSAFAQNPPALDARTNNSAQETNNLRGKMIRIQLLATPGSDGKYYQVPSDNPFIGNSAYSPEIYSLGHRNPWRWAFDTVSPYTLWETEVGQAAFEEVNHIVKGKNYGWPICEGTTNRGALGGNASFNCVTATATYQTPVEGTATPAASASSIIGGFVYRGTALPALTGKFIFGDYNTKKIYSVASGATKSLVSDAFPNYMSSFGTDFNGNSIFITSHGTEYAAQGATSVIYKMVDDNAAAAVIPPTLSTTGLFADLSQLIPSAGVIEYAVNTNGWFDGATARHFISIPNDQKIGFDPSAPWSLPVGTVLVKHLSIAATNNPNKPFVTSVLFRQADGSWQAANYRWNTALTDANLVTTTTVVTDGGTVSRQRAVQAASDCGGCHSGSGSKPPLAVGTYQFNGNFNYSGVIANQLTTFNSIGLFSSTINPANTYAKFAAPSDATASVDLRARSYLHTNCAHCHSSRTFMDMRFDTPLADMKLIGEGSGTVQRVKPFEHINSLVYLYQTNDANRMPRGTLYTNPLADVLFKDWINAPSAVKNGVKLTATKTQVSVGETTTMKLFDLFSNGFFVPTKDVISWGSSAPAVMSTEGKTVNDVVLTGSSAGVTSISASAGGFGANMPITVTPPVGAINSINIDPNLAGSLPLASGTQQLVATGNRADGTLANLFGQVTWSVISGSTVASVSSTGLLTRLTSGTATVQASWKDPANSTSPAITKTLTVTNGAPGLSLRYSNPNGWAKVYIYTWTVVNGVIVEPVRWPGIELKAVGGWWAHVVDPANLSNGTVNVIFNNNAGAQTPDKLNISASSSFNGTSWTPWAGSGGLGTTTVRLSVIGGTLPSAVVDFLPGTVVTLTANAPLPNTTFGGWTGDAAPYLVTDPKNPVAQLLIPTGKTTMSISALFNGSADLYKSGRNLYASMCSGCHGVNGVGKTAPRLDSLTGYTLESLISKIATSMPQGGVGTCVGNTVGNCAYDISNMILNNGWTPPCTSPSGCSTSGLSLDARNQRLLTREEYLNTIRDIFGINFAASIMSPVPGDGTSRNYDTASFLALDYDRTSGYQSVATTVSQQVITAKSFLSLAPGCSNTICVVRNLGLKLFRRPLTPTEETRYVGLYDAADAGKAVLQGMLISPKFLYRSEMGVLDPTTNLYKLTNFEIATLLSYSFWASAPDDTLLAAAASPTFDIKAQATRLLADARAERGLRRFASGWLIDSKYGFPAISSNTLVSSFIEETMRFTIESIKADVPYKTMLTANYTYANSELASYYGLPAVPANTWAKSFFPNSDPRMGIGVLGHGSYLASRVSSTENPSPIKRGLFVRGVLMCQELPPPVAAGVSIPRSPSDSNRKAFFNHTNDPACYSCHQYIDGVGFGFENYGSNAKYRTTEVLGNGVVQAIDASGMIKSLNSAETHVDPNSQEVTYNSVPELAKHIADSGQASACYSRQFYRYIVGRNEEASDENIIPLYSAKVRAGGGMREMLIELTTTPSFILRR